MILLVELCKYPISAVLRAKAPAAPSAIPISVEAVYGCTVSMPEVIIFPPRATASAVIVTAPLFPPSSVMLAIVAVPMALMVMVSSAVSLMGWMSMLPAPAVLASKVTPPPEVI